MNETWKFEEFPSALTSQTAVEQLRTRINEGQLETWLTSSSGRLLAIVTNGQRAMVMLLDDDADPGQHAVDPAADGKSDGFVLANGQHDEYANKDTIPLSEALRIVRHLVDEGNPPSDVTWAIDR
ncbi:hypothetical protein ACGFNU_49965 [Spirillospora sp. NPDC048911]|uniref:hypothetical protein n=1 Tax=Spirillospora sp. NPDC048911 TaxID=3364527 RepID=UPI003720587D